MIRNYYNQYKHVSSSYKKTGFFSLSISNRVLRYLSFFITPFFLKLNISANVTTCLSGGIGVLATLFIFFGTKQYLIIGLWIFLFSLLIDFVDGNIARVKGTSTFFGKFIDGYIDIITLTALRLSLAFFVFVNNGPHYLIWIGVLSVILTPYHHLTLDRYSAYARWITEDTSVQLEPYLRNKIMPLTLGNMMCDLQCVLIFIIMFNPYIGLVVFFTVGVVEAIFCIISHLLAASKYMRVERRSPKISDNFMPSINYFKESKNDSV
jgi:phosphatidylglycerophosphate synthase